MKTIKLPSDIQKPISLDFSGTALNGDEFTTDSVTMRKNGIPILPIGAEFQYSRYSESEWEKGLRKIKASGATIIDSYVFWIHHEEERGVYRFDGCRDIRKFALLCQKIGLYLFLRVGPWVTGECKNGGFPDWVVDLPDVQGKIHGNTPQYMQAVREFYEAYYKQVEGLMIKDGGPIIGLQLENEYTIHRSFNIPDGEAYMHELKKMLCEIGFIVPFYTRTGWGFAINPGDELLPTYGAYCDAPWANSLKEEPALNRFLFIDEKLYDTIHFSVEANLTEQDIVNTLPDDKLALYNRFKALKPFPLLTSELGGGMQPSKMRRVVCEEDDNEALTVCMLGRGANYLGYYIFHGGTHPNGKFDTMQSTNNGVTSNDYPKKSYDFDAPIAESTLLRHTYHTLKSRFMMIHTVEDLLPICEVYYPDDNAKDENDVESTRYSIRYNAENGAGFIFVNNHIRQKYMPIKNLDLTLQTVKGDVVVPTIRLLNHEMAIIPFNLPLPNATLISTNAELLTNLGDTYFFFTNHKPIYNLDGEAKIVTLNKNDAIHSYKIGNKLYISKEIVYELDGTVVLESLNFCETVGIYDETGKRKNITLTTNEVKQSCNFKLVENTSSMKCYEVDMSNLNVDNVEDIIMTTDFIGDRAEIYDKNGELITDWFTTGEKYQISLKRFGYSEKLTVKIFESEPDGTVYFDIPVESGCELRNITLNSLYQMEIDSL